MNKNILIISAHADDNLMCAGTVFKLSKKGFVPNEIVFTNSGLGQNYKKQNEVKISKNIAVRSTELKKASKFLGINKSFLFNINDLNLRYSPELMFETVKIIREIKPEIVFLHNPYDMHPDHIASYEIGINAVKIASYKVKIETLGKPFRVPLVLCSEGMLPVKSQILVDTSEFADIKLKLFKIYVSQASPSAINFEKSLGTIRGYHLRKKGSFFAEAFTLQEEFPVLLFE